MNCKYCEKVCKNRNSLTQHEIRCKMNENRIEIKSNFIKWNEDVKNGIVTKKYSNQYIKAKESGSPKPIVSEETRRKIGDSTRGVKWSNEKRKRHSKIMKETVRNNSESYSSKNVCGRVKQIDVTDSYGNETKVNGSWELIVSQYLDSNNIKWSNIIVDGFEYEFLNKSHLYFPDFYLPELNVYIEVKGYQRERDLAKWKHFKNKLIIIKKKEIQEIKNGEYNIFKSI